MRRLKKDRREITSIWTSGEAAPPQAKTCAASPYENSAQVVLREISRVWLARSSGRETRFRATASRKLNDEVGSRISDAAFAAKFAKVIAADDAHAKAITLAQWRQRSVFARARDWLALASG